MDERVLEPTREGTLEEIQNCRRKIGRLLVIYFVIILLLILSGGGNLFLLLMLEPCPTFRPRPGWGSNR